MATKKAEWLASIKPILDKEEVKNDAKALARELSDILDFKVDTDAESIRKLTEEFNNQLKQMGKQEVVFSEKTLQGIVSQFASAIAKGFAKGATLGTDEALRGQLEALKKQREAIAEERDKLNKNINARNRMNRIEDFDIRTAKPIKVDGDIGKEAQKLVDGLYQSADQIDQAIKQYGKNSVQYRDTVLDAQEAYNKYLRMQKTLGAMSNSELFTIPKDVLALYDKLGQGRDKYEAAGGLNIPFDESFEAEKIMDAYEELSDAFEVSVDGAIKLEKQLKQIDLQIDDISKKLRAIESGDDIIGDDAKNGIKSLQEIEAAYDRILAKKSKKDADKFSGIKSAVDYIPGSESLAVLKNRYDKSWSSNEDWEVQYQWLVKFVKEYEAYSAKIEAEPKGIDRRNMEARLRKYSELYNSLSPIARGAEESLRQIIGGNVDVPKSGNDRSFGPTPEDVDNAQKIADAERQAREEAEKKKKAEEEALELAKKKKIEDEKAAAVVEKKRIEEEKAADAAERKRVAEEAIAVLRRMSEDSSKNEKYTYLDTKNGKASDYITGETYGVKIEDIQRLLASYGDSNFDATLHTHPYNVAAPSGKHGDLQIFEDKFEQFKKNFILAGEQLAEIDFSSLSKDIVDRIKNKFIEKESSIDEDFDSPIKDIVSVTKDVYPKLYEWLSNNLVSSLSPTMERVGGDTNILGQIVQEYIAKLKSFFESNNVSELSRDELGEKFASIAKDALVTQPQNIQKALRSGLAGYVSVAFEQLSGIDVASKNMMQKALQDAFITTLQELNLDSSKIFKLYNAKDFDFGTFKPKVQNNIGSQQETAVHQENVEAIKAETKAQKELNTVKAQNNDIDDNVEVIEKENGTLENKLELLREIADQYGNTITQKQRNRYEELNQKDMNSGLNDKENDRYYELGEQIDAADEALEEFGQTYDRIILKLANGKKVEILPDDNGLRSLYKFADEYGETYNGIEIEDVVFERVKKEADAHQQNAETIKIESKAQEELNATKAQNPDFLRAYNESSAEAQSALQEYARLFTQANQLRQMSAGEDLGVHNISFDATQEQLNQIVLAWKEYRSIIQEISSMQVVNTEDDKKRLMELQAKAVSLYNTFKQGRLNDSTTGGYAKHYGISTEDAQLMRSDMDIGYGGVVKDFSDSLNGLSSKGGEVLDVIKGIDSALYNALMTASTDELAKVFDTIKNSASGAKEAIDGVSDANKAVGEGGSGEAVSDELNAAIKENQALQDIIAGKDQALSDKDAELARINAENDALQDRIQKQANEAADEAYRNQQARAELYDQISDAEERARKTTEESTIKDGVIQELREQLGNVKTGENVAKASIDVEELKNVLNAITYNVKVVQDAENIDNKVAIDEVSLETTFNKVFANIINRPTQQNDGEQKQSPWALESTLQSVKAVLDQIQTNTARIGTPNSDAVRGSALSGTLGTIKAAIDAINGKIVQGTKVSVPPAGQPRSTVTPTTGNPLLDAKIDSKFSSLSLLYTKLEANGQLTDEIRDKWMLLWDSLDNVNDNHGLQLWNQQLAQVKNSIQEILIANNLLESEGKASFNELIGVTKLYNKMAVGAQNATTPELKSFYTNEANSLLVEQQRLLNGIALTQEQQVKFDALEVARKREINKIVAAQADKQNKVDLAEQANIVKTLNKLYQEYGVLVERAGAASGSFAKQLNDEVAAKEAEIQSAIGLVGTITQEMSTAFDKSFNKGRSIESNKQYEKLAKESDSDEEAKLKKIAKLEKEIGSLRADYDNATNDNVRNALNEEISLREKLIELQRQGPQMDESDEAYYRKKLSNATKTARGNATQDDRERARVLNEQAKADDKIWAKRVKEAQRVTGVNMATSVANASDQSVLRAIGVEGISVDIQEKAKELENQIKALRRVRDEIQEKGDETSEKDKASLSQQITQVKKLKTELDDYLKIHEKYSGDNAEDLGDATGFGAVGTDEYWNRITAAINKQSSGRAVIKGLNADTGELTGTTKIAANTFETWSATVDPLTGRLVMLRTGIKKTETMFEAVSRKTKEIFTYFSGSSLIFKFFNEIKKGVQYIREIDSALTELKKVTDETEEAYDEFLQTAAKTAGKVGSTIKEIVSSTADWARLGYSMQDAAKFAESTQILMNVSEFTDVSQATDTLISAVQAFGYTADTSMEVVDLLNIIGNNYAISTADLAQSLTKSSASLVAAGGDLAEAAALTATANAIVQDADSVGTALKTTSLRLRGTDVKTLEEEGLDSEGAVTSKSKLRGKVKAISGVDILTETGEYKSTYEILSQIADVWSDINDMDQAALLELISGKRNASVVAAILQSPEELKQAYEDAQNAEGSALKENEKYLDSIQGRIDLFTNSIQTMWSNALSSDAVKTIVNLGTGIIKIIDNVGLLQFAFAGLFTYISTKLGGINFSKIFSGLTLKGVNRIFGKSINKDIQSTTSKLEELERSVRDAKQAYIDDGGSKSSKKALKEAEESLETYKKLQKEGFKQTDPSKDYFGTEIQKIKDYKKELQAVEEASAQAQQNLARAQANLDNYQGTDPKKLYKYQDGLKRAQVNVNTLNKKQADLKKDGSGAFQSLAKGADKFSQKIQSAVASMLVMYAVSKVIQLITAFFDKIVETAEEAKESFDELKSKLSTTESELSTLESKLEDITDQIKDINNNAPLTFTDQEELSRLKAESAELQRQIDLLNTIKEQQARGVNESAINAANKYAKAGVETGKTAGENIGEKAGSGALIGAGVGVASGVGGAILSGAALGAWAGPLGMLLGAAIGAAIGAGIGAAVGGIQSATEETVGESLDNMREQYAKLQKEFDVARENYKNDASDKNKEKFEEAQEALNKYKSNMADYMSEMDSYYSQIKQNWDAATTEQKQEYLEWADKMDAWAIQTGGANAKSNAFARIFGDEATDGFAKAKSQIEAINVEIKKAKETGDEVKIAEALASLDGFTLNGILSDEEIARLREMGLYLYEAEDYFKNVTRAELEFKDVGLLDVAKDINKITDGVEKLKTAFDEIIERGSVTSKTVTDLYEHFQNFNATEDGAKAWIKYSNAVFSGVSSVEEMTKATEDFVKEYLDWALANNELTPENKWTYIVQLQNLGVKNAREYVEELLGKNLTKEIEKSMDVNVDAVKKAYEESMEDADDSVLPFEELSDDKIKELAKEYGIIGEVSDDVKQKIQERYDVEGSEIDGIIAELKEEARIKKQIDDARKKKSEYDDFLNGTEGQKGYRALKEELDGLEQSGAKLAKVSDVGTKYHRDGTTYWEYGGKYYLNGDEEVETAAYKYAKATYDAYVEQYRQYFDENGILLSNVPVEIQTEITNAESELERIQNELNSQSPEVKLELDLQTFNTSVDKIQDAYSSLKAITVEYNKQGYLSLDNLQALLNLSPEYLSVLQMEGGQLTINQGALEAMLQTKLADAEATAVQTAITQLNALAERKQATEVSNSAIAANQASIELGRYSGALSTVAQDAIIAAGSVATFNAALKGAQNNPFVSDEEWQQVLTNFQNTIGLIDSVRDNLPTSFNDILDPGSKTAKEEEADDAFKRAMEYWENRISANRARYEQIQNEIDLLDKKGQKANADYYQEQVKLEKEHQRLLEQQKAEAEQYLGVFKEGSDEWFRKKPAYWETNKRIPLNCWNFLRALYTTTQG